jgi:hypothetical protein
MGKRFVFALIAAGAAGALLGAGGMLLVNWPKQTPSIPAVPAVASQPRWTEVKWPFPMDQWGPGKAFRCAPADCGSEVGLYVRAKIGFCNCTTGVADDEELDRVADFELFTPRQSPVGPGREISVGSMKGRSRGYLIADPTVSTTRSMLAIAYNERCDVIVATVAMQHDRPNVLEASAIDFLKGDAVMQWAALKLGL